MKSATGTREWASTTYNFQVGCEHGCWYCYAKAMAVRFGRCTPAEWTTPGLLPPKPCGKRSGRIMVPSTHDITPANLPEALRVLVALASVGNELLVVSKPSKETVRSLCIGLEPWREQVEFRFTIGTADDEPAAFWEPGAPPIRERLAALRIAHDQGYRCSVSVEPMLDTIPDDVLLEVESRASSVWFGRANGLASRLALNGAPEEVRERGRWLMEQQSDAWVRGLYRAFKHVPVVRWKDSIRKVVGLPPVEAPE